MPTTTALPTLTTKDLTSDQQVRWCPGCGDYSILAQMKKALAGIGGIWVWFFLRQLGRRPLLPLNDPYLREALAHE